MFKGEKLLACFVIHWIWIKWLDYSEDAGTIFCSSEYVHQSFW